ncbi:MAG: t4-like baseplate wedge, partial [Deltaproteobacteria bacterium]|nr:t4-like baseplate wedge [Deltaproteobacteria bacterium]
MSILSPQTDFTDVDFDSLRLRLMSLITSVFPEWSDFDTAAFGNILLEMYAFVG